MSTRVTVEKATRIYELQERINERLKSLEDTLGYTIIDIKIMYDRKYIGMIVYDNKARKGKVHSYDGENHTKVDYTGGE